MKISVSLWGQLKQNAGVGEVCIELAGETGTVEAVLRELVRQHESALGKLLVNEEGELRKSTLVFRGDTQITSPAEAVSDGDSITVMSPISGG